jgi:hypothetical protein
LRLFTLFLLHKGLEGLIYKEMRIIFLLFFGYLLYQFLIKPIFIGMRGEQLNRPRSPQNDLLEMMRRMEELKKQQYQQYQQQEQQTQQTQQAPQKTKPSQNDGEYIDYEEVD